MSVQHGWFIAIDGPSGIGKSTITGLLAAVLSAHGLPVLATKEPTATPLGSLARFGTDDYRGLSLACLVAADRYQHLEQEIRPALRAGRIVICDRYVASSLVLQGLDGVPADFVWQLNQHADRPDLCVILTGDAACARNRAEKRGLYSRFHRGGYQAGVAEAALYDTAAAELAERGFDVLTHEVGSQTPSNVAEALARTILARRQAQRDAS
jgi:dTMP kinase